MDYQKDYVKKLNFKDYEKTNALAYELIMRNKECQKCFIKLHKIICRRNEIEQLARPLLNAYNESEEIKTYYNERWKIDQNILDFSNLQNSFLKTVHNYLLILKGTYEEGEHAKFFTNYLDQLQRSLQSDNSLIKYAKQVSYIHNIIQIFRDEAYHRGLEMQEINQHTKNLIESFIQDIGYKIISRKHDNVVDFSSTKDKQNVIETFQNYINQQLGILGIASDLGADKLLNEKKYLIHKDMETYYANYRKYLRKINRLEQLRHATESYMSYEFYIDFQQKLYLDYPFFTQILQKDLLEFYQILQQKEYAELEIPHHANIRKKEIVSHDDFSLDLETFFSIDKQLMNQLDSLQFRENMLKLMKKNPNEFIFRSTFIKLNYARPRLFSERFRDITLTFNPNLSKKELKLQFETIIDLYQSDKLKNRSIYEIVGEEFGKWSKKIERPKRAYSTKKVEDRNSNAAKNILTIINNIPDLLYIYDSHIQEITHTQKTYPTNMSESSISSYLNMALFLIDEKGYKILLTAHR